MEEAVVPVREHDRVEVRNPAGQVGEAQEVPGEAGQDTGLAWQDGDAVENQHGGGAVGRLVLCGPLRGAAEALPQCILEADDRPVPSTRVGTLAEQWEVRRQEET